MISGAEFNYATNRTTGIFAMALRRDVKHPFPPESDEVTVVATAPGAGRDRSPSGPTDVPAPATLTIDFDGLAARVARVPLEADNYGGLTAKKGHLLYVVGPGFYYGRQSDRKPSLRLYSLKDRKETTLVDDAAGYALSSDGSKVLVRAGGAFTLHDATPAGANAKKSVSTAGLMVDRVPVEEWRQIFDEVWRQYRDWFYVPNMHGYDWAAMREAVRTVARATWRTAPTSTTSSARWCRS